MINFCNNYKIITKIRKNFEIYIKILNNYMKNYKEIFIKDINIAITHF